MCTGQHTERSRDLVFVRPQCGSGGGGGGGAYGGCPVATSVVGYPTYAEVMAGYAPNATAEFLNASSATRVMNYRNGSGAPHQVWFDDPETLAVKYAALRAAGVAALGMWTADSAGDNASAAAAMWRALPH